MSTAVMLRPLPEEVKSLSHEEWWTLFDELRLSQQAEYAKHGGAVAFIRKERSADGDHC